MKEFQTRLLYCIKNPLTHLIVIYLLLAWFFFGSWGQIAVEIILIIIAFWILIALLDYFIFDPLLTWAAKRDEEKHKRELHELTSRYR